MEDTMSQSKKKSSQAKFRSAPKSQRRSASKPVARRVKARSSSSNDAALIHNRKWFDMIKKSHITDLADTPPAPDGSDKASVSVNPLPAIDEVGLRFLRDLYQQAFGFEEIVFEIGDAGTYIYSEGGEGGRAEIVVEVKDPQQAYAIKRLLDFAAHLAGTSTEFIQ
jgi:hypothetical protein